MKTCTKPFAIVKQVRCLCASILILGASAVYANPATVIDEFTCGAYFPNETGGLTDIVLYTTTQRHKVITDKGVNVLSCHFDHDEELTFAIGAQGFLCGITDGSGIMLVTRNSMMLAAPGGRATLVCKINGDEIHQ